MNKEHIQEGIKKIAEILGTIQEACEDSNMKSYWTDAVDFFERWNRRLNVGAICGYCKRDEWVEQKIVKLKSRALSDSSGIREYSQFAQYRYICAACGHQLSTSTD